MTGILTETANLTNSYQYDSYGNLTSGTADGVNYYGYNGESTNVKTGLQYLRARYYNAENGTFTTEDSDLGTTENPLTRNRYDYTTNNPLNYSDPTGHSLWSRIKSAAKKAVKTVTKAVKSVAKTVVSGVKAAAKWVQNAVSHPKQVIQQAKNTVKQKAKQTYQKVASAGSGFVKAVSNGGIRGGFSYVGNGAKKVYSSFKSYAAERTSEIRAIIHKEMCTTNNRISSLLGKVDWNAVKKVVAGGVILGGLAAATVLTGGAAAVIVGGALSGALIGGGTGAVLGGISSAASGEGFISGAADGFLWGTIGGAVSGGVGAATGSLASSTASSALKNPLAKSAIENAADTAVGTIDDLAHGRDVTAQDVALDFAKGMISSGLSKNSGTLDSDSNHLTDTEISWPSKPHTNKTEGHWETIVDKTNELAESGEYKKIYVNKGIRNEVKDVTPNRRADITVVKRDDKIDLFEVPSKSDDPDKLVERMKEVNKQLGDINLVYIKK